MNWPSGLRSLLDMYSDRWPQRIAVFVVIAAGGFLLATHRIQGALFFVLLVWANRERFFESMGARLARQRWLVIAPALIAMGARIVSTEPAAHDDLLRHIASAFYPGGYADMYVYSSLPPNALYPSFDWLVGNVALRVGPVWTMWIVQAVAWSAFVAVFVAAALRVLPRDDDRLYWVLGVLLLVVSTVAIRLSLGRPEVFIAIWALAALVVRTRTGVTVWAVTGLLLGTGYWLTPIYFPAVLLLPLSARQRLLLFVVMCIMWSAIWFAVSGADPLGALLWLEQAMASRIVTVGENASAVNLVALPGFVVLLGAATWAAFRKERDLRLPLLAAYFLLSDQARYVTVVSPLLALFFLSAVRSTKLDWSPRRRFGAVVASILLAPATVASVPRLHELPAFLLPWGSVVLTDFTQASFAMPFYNPGAVRVAPAFEVGASELWIQAVLDEMAKGDFDCDRIRGRGFTHVVENSLKAVAPPCLRLAAVNGAWRLWRVRD